MMNMMRTVGAVLSYGAWSGAALAQGTAETDRSIVASLDGRWAGVLEYRDYQSDGRVQIPAVYVVEASVLTASFTSRVEFTDPGRVIVSEGAVSIVGDRHLDLGLGEEGGLEVMTVDERRFTDAGDWTLVLIGEGFDNGEPVDERVTRVMDGDTFRSTKDVRPRGDADALWAFRNEIRLEREDPDAAALVGSWTIDLRPSAGADPYLVKMKIRSIEGGAIEGTFYDGSPIRDGRVTTAFGVVRFAFTTGDGSGAYHTSGEIRGGRVSGLTHSVGRGFLMPWRGERGE
ncbi:MAG: hypothetical protein DHS20C14_16330 [Phycisphaeraceae bacterium]|nr:MAG: hypothetical protein DHS20C14_16330 [Phycisphaeraceae bacterium]